MFDSFNYALLCAIICLHFAPYVVFRAAQRVHVNHCFNYLHLFICNLTLYIGDIQVLHNADGGGGVTFSRKNVTKV